MKFVGLALLSAFLSATPAYALKFLVIPDDGFGQRVLLIHDCTALAENKDCTDTNSHFAQDDEKRLRAAWTGQFQEVWLLSAGGNLDAGIAIGNELRARGATVRVPGGPRLLRAGYHITRDRHCISACTVAFMGGQFRFIDPDATYEVHSASSVSWSDITKELFAYIDEIEGDIRSRGLRAVATDRTSGDRQLAKNMFVLFQETLWLPIQNQITAADRRQRDQTLNDWVRDGLSQGYRYDAAQLERDQKILDLEGLSALQDILMRIERTSMDKAIADIRSAVPKLGKRADAALAMLAAMYDTSSIKETNRVPRETLVKMGYITEFTK
jgi:hypothetical protein